MCKDCEGCEHAKLSNEGFKETICLELTIICDKLERCPIPSRRKEKEMTRFEKLCQQFWSIIPPDVLRDALVVAGYEPGPIIAHGNRK